MQKRQEEAFNLDPSQAAGWEREEGEEEKVRFGASEALSHSGKSETSGEV